MNNGHNIPFSSCTTYINISQRTHGAMITPLLRKTASQRRFSHNNDVIIASCVRWCVVATALTHWGRVTYKCVSKLDHHLFRWWLNFIIWNNARLLSVGPLGTNLSEIGLKIQTFSYKEISSKMSTAKWWPFYLGLNVFKVQPLAAFNLKTGTWK